MNSDELYPTVEIPGMQAASLQSLSEAEQLPAAVADENASFAAIREQEAVAEQPEGSAPSQGSTGVPDPWEEPAIGRPGAAATPKGVEMGSFSPRESVTPPSPFSGGSPGAATGLNPLDLNPSDLNRTTSLQQQVDALQQEIGTLRQTRAQLQSQITEAQSALGRLVQDGLADLEQRKQALQVSVEQLERRQERIRKEMRSTFAGSSQEVAIRVQSFKDYLVGSLQDLAMAAEQLNLATPAPRREPDQSRVADAGSERSSGERVDRSGGAKFAESSFQEQAKRIRSLIDQYRNRPDYYGPTWQLRRTFEPIHAERVSNWFFSQGGRGALRTMGSRLQNILVASATISILHAIYGNRLRTLVLAQSPERLGEWRRGLQDCLGITRSDFGPDRGVALFEDPFPLAQKADRMVKDGLMPFIIIDDTEDQISLTLLQFPLWLAFAPNPQVPNYTF
jgi:chaperonin cofactor prefoldin